MSMFSLLPKKVRTALFRLGMQPVRAARQLENAAIPTVELAEKHLRNLRVLPTRADLLAQLPPNAVVAEVGVDHGDFSEEILRIAQPKRLYLVDIWGSARYHDGLAQLVQRKFASQISAGQIEIKRGLSTEQLPLLDDASLDWVYIDTDHSYATTKAELEICRTKVKAGGIIAGHDYITGSWINGVRYGVVEAVHEFCVKYDWEILFLTHETDRHLSFAIRQIG